MEDENFDGDLDKMYRNILSTYNSLSLLQTYDNDTFNPPASIYRKKETLQPNLDLPPLKPALPKEPLASLTSKRFTSEEPLKNKNNTDNRDRGGTKNHIEQTIKKRTILIKPNKTNSTAQRSKMAGPTSSPRNDTTNRHLPQVYGRNVAGGKRKERNIVRYNIINVQSHTNKYVRVAGGNDTQSERKRRETERVGRESSWKPTAKKKAGGREMTVTVLPSISVYNRLDRMQRMVDGISAQHSHRREAGKESRQGANEKVGDSSNTLSSIISHSHRSGFYPHYYADDGGERRGRSYENSRRRVIEDSGHKEEEEEEEKEKEEDRVERVSEDGIRFGGGSKGSIKDYQFEERNEIMGENHDDSILIREEYAMKDIKTDRDSKKYLKPNDIEFRSAEQKDESEPQAELLDKPRSLPQTPFKQPRLTVDHKRIISKSLKTHSELGSLLESYLSSPSTQKESKRYILSSHMIQHMDMYRHMNDRLLHYILMFARIECFDPQDYIPHSKVCNTITVILYGVVVEESGVLFTQHDCISCLSSRIPEVRSCSCFDVELDRLDDSEDSDVERDNILYEEGDNMNENDGQLGKFRQKEMESEASQGKKGPFFLSKELQTPRSIKSPGLSLSKRALTQGSSFHTHTPTSIVSLSFGDIMKIRSLCTVNNILSDYFSFILSFSPNMSDPMMDACMRMDNNVEQ